MAVESVVPAETVASTAPVAPCVTSRCRDEKERNRQCAVLIVAENRQVREVLHQIFLGAGYTCQVASVVADRVQRLQNGSRDEGVSGGDR